MHELENRGLMKKILLVDDRKVYCTALSKYIETELLASYTEIEVKSLFSLNDVSDAVNSSDNLDLILLNIDLDETESALLTLDAGVNHKTNIAIILRTLPRKEHGDLLERILGTAKGVFCLKK